MLTAVKEVLTKKIMTRCVVRVCFTPNTAGHSEGQYQGPVLLRVAFTLYLENVCFAELVIKCSLKSTKHHHPHSVNLAGLGTGRHVLVNSL